MKWFLFQIFLFVLCLPSTQHAFASNPEMISHVNVHYLCQNIFHPAVRAKYFDQLPSEASQIIDYPKNNNIIIQRILDTFQNHHQSLDQKLSRAIAGTIGKIQEHPDHYKISTIKVEGEEEINEFFSAWHISVRSRILEEYSRTVSQAELDRRLFYWNRTTGKEAWFKTSLATAIAAGAVAGIILLQPDNSMQLNALTLTGGGALEALSLGYVIGYVREYLNYFNTQVDRGFDKQYVHSGEPIVLDQKFFDSLLTKKFLTDFYNPSTLTHSFGAANKFLYFQVQEISPEHVVFLFLSFSFNHESEKPELKVHYIHRHGF